MRAFEFTTEQTIGTTGSTSGTPGTIQSVSQTPSAPRPVDPTSPDANKTTTQDPNLQKLAATLKQNKVIANDKEINDFMSAYTAQAGKKTLTPDQQEIMSKLAPALMKDKTLDTKLDLQLKTMSAQKPGTAPATTQPAGTPVANPQGIK